MAIPPLRIKEVAASGRHRRVRTERTFADSANAVPGGEWARSTHTLRVVDWLRRHDVPTAVRAMKDGAFDFLARPFDDSELLRVLSNAIERSRVALLDQSGRLGHPCLKLGPQTIDQLGDGDVVARVDHLDEVRHIEQRCWQCTRLCDQPHP